MPLDLEPNGATTTPFDDLRCVDCDHLWAEHSRILDDPGLHFVMDNNTAEEVRQHLVGLTAERDALKAELGGLRRYLTRSIANDIDGMEDVSDLLEGLPEEDYAMIDRWASAMSDPAYWAPEITRMSAEVEDLRTENAQLRIARAQNNDELERLRTELAKVEQRFIVRLEPGCWLAPWKGDPGRTTVQESAKRFRTAAAAWSALKKARQMRPFTAAAVERVP